MRYLKITGDFHDWAPADHVLRKTFNSTCLILLGTGVPPCSIIMSSQKQNSQITQSESEAWQCKGCKKTIVDKNSKLLLCEYCDNAYCIECLQLSVSAYNVCKKNSLHWFCAHCEDKVMQNLRNDREIEEHSAEFLKKIEARVAALEGQIASKVDEKQVRKIVENITISIIKEPPTQSHEAVLATVKDCCDSIN